MIHPLLTPRLFSQPRNQEPFPPVRRKDANVLKYSLTSAAARAYLRWGSGTGFILGLAIAYWLWLPNPGG